MQVRLIEKVARKEAKKLGINFSFGKARVSANGSYRCKLNWTGLMGGSRAEALGEGPSKLAARAAASVKMLEFLGVLPELPDSFRADCDLLHQALADGRVEEAGSQALQLMDGYAPDQSGWLWFIFLPATLCAVVARGKRRLADMLLKAAQENAVDAGGMRVGLWEAMLDQVQASTLRHRQTVTAVLQGIGRIPLCVDGFASEEACTYFAKWRCLLALEGYASVLSGISRFEQEPRAWSGVLTAAVRSVQETESSSQVVLTVLDGLEDDDAVERASPWSGTYTLLLPPEALDRPENVAALVGSPSLALPKIKWDHPRAWLGIVDRVRRVHSAKTDTEELCMYVDRVSFGLDDDWEDEGSRGLSSAGAAPDQQYFVLNVSTGTPQSRMIEALHRVCAVEAPLWGTAAGRADSHFTPALRKIITGSPAQSKAASEQSVSPAAREVASEIYQGGGKEYSGLTARQRFAVSRAAHMRMSLIQGPPGTGKTHVACSIVNTWLKQTAGGRILVVADSNVAADNLHVRLTAVGIDSVRLGRSKQLDAAEYGSDSTYAAARSAEVIATTCIGSGVDVMRKVGPFNRVIIDECTQSTEPAVLVALGHGCEQLVVIGDYGQLPATVLSDVAQRGGLAVSFMERMLTESGVQSLVLVEQRRMHSSISEFPSKVFYYSKLVDASNDAELPIVPGFPWPNPDCRVCFVDTSGMEGVEEKNGFSWFNKMEAKIVVDVLEGVFKEGVSPDDVCVLTPYIAQRRAIYGELNDRDWRGSVLSSVIVDTIDGYQGMEKDLVIFSAARSNAKRELGFVSDARRMNVMLTRGRRGVIVIGDGATLRNCTSDDSKWSDWIEWAESRESVVRCERGRLDFTRLVPSVPCTTEADSDGTASSPEAPPASDDRPRRPVEPASPAAGRKRGGERGEAPPPADLELAPGWGSAVDSATGRKYYFNSATGETSWSQPAPGHRSQTQVDLPPGWECGEDPDTGGTYYFHRTSGQSSWTVPDEAAQNVETPPDDDGQVLSQWRRELCERVSAFAAGAAAQLALPGLTSRERYLVHDEAKKHGLFSRSSGSGPGRVLTLLKVDPRKSKNTGRGKAKGQPR